MNKKIKQLSIVLPLSFILASLAILSSLLDPYFVPDLYRISSLIILTLWAFFITPTILFAINWIKETCENETPEQAFRSGARIGVFFGIGGIVLLCLLVSPVVGTIWFAQTIKEISVNVKANKKRTENSTDNSEIFDI